MHAVGTGVILSNRYHSLSVIGSQSIGIAPDEHEFNVMENGRTALMTSYRPRRYDLSELNLTNGIGWLLDSWFYEVDLQNNKIIYSWSALEHVDPSDSQLPLSQVEGTGFQQDNAWDFL